MISTHLVLLIAVTSTGPFNIICIYSTSMALDLLYPGTQVGKVMVDFWPNGSQTIQHKHSSGLP